jgi:hypothetical protein
MPRSDSQLSGCPSSAKPLKAKVVDEPMSLDTLTGGGELQEACDRRKERIQRHKTVMSPTVTSTRYIMQRYREGRTCAVACSTWDTAAVLARCRAGKAR